MLIAIPSKGRAGHVRSREILTTATLFVPAGEAPDYERLDGGNVVPVPADVTGITATRNWVLGWAEEQGEADLVFVDDDVKAAGWVQLLPTQTSHNPLPERVWLAEFAKIFDVARGVGARIWGLATQSASRSVYPWKPFRWHSYVTASCMGLCLEHGLRFDPSFAVKEDYELCLRCLRDDGLIVSAQYLYWENAHWDTEGGCKTYRTQAMEETAIRRLMGMYPGYIRRVTRGGSGYSIELQF
jgi:hypothetical protein